MLGSLNRADVTIERARGEALAGRRAWDVAVSRATLAPADWLEAGTTLAAPGGTVWVLLAKDSPPAHPRATLAGQSRLHVASHGRDPAMLGYRSLP